MKKFLVVGLMLLGPRWAFAGGTSTPSPVFIPSIVTVSSTSSGASGSVAVTISSPVATSYSSGLYTYMTNVHIEMYPLANLAVAGGPIKCTSTNLNSAAWFFSATQSSGTVQVLDMQFANPYPAPNSAINTVITCPSTANVLWNIIAGYYFAS